MNTGFLLLSMPRAGGTALARMIGETHGIDTAGGIDRGPEMAACIRGGDLPEGGQGFRLTAYGHRSARDAMGRWSRLMRAFPGLQVILLTREVDDAFELGLIAAHDRLIPDYGTCFGCCFTRAKEQLRLLEDFHAMNPARTVLLRHEDLADHATLAAKLGALAPSPEVWERIGEERPNSQKAEWARRKMAEPGRDDEKLLLGPMEGSDPFGDADPFEGEAEMPADASWHKDPAEPIPVPANRKSRPPRPFITAWPEADRAIVYPWLSTAAAWEELRYSLRSVHEHFTDRECPIYILGDAPPPWLRTGGRVIWRAVQGYAPDNRGEPLNRRRGMWEAQVTGVQLAERVLWMNDDIHLLRATGWSDLETALTEGALDHLAGRLMESENGWKRGLGRAVADLRAARPGVPVMRFATHTPYLFERERSVEILRAYHLSYKGSWVTLYHNHHGTPHEPCGPHKTRTLPERPGVRFLNYNDYTLTAELKAAILKRWPEPAPWEFAIPAEAAPESGGVAAVARP